MIQTAYLSEKQSFGPRHPGAVRSVGSTVRGNARTYAGTEAPALACCIPRALGACSEAKRESQNPLDWSHPVYYRAHCCPLPISRLHQ